MIKRLRKRFIRIATLAVTGVMLVLCIALNTANFLSVRAEQQRMLDMICDNQGTLPSAPPGGGQQPGGGRGDGSFTPETPFSTRYFVLRYNDEGTLVHTDFAHIAAVTEDDADQYLPIALRRGEGGGISGGYSYRVVHVADERWMAVFLDSSQQLRSVMTTALLSLAVMAGCVALVYLIVVLCSRRAIEPVVQANRKQKQFITDASYELKTPITVIATSLKLLEMDVGQQKWIDKARAQTEKLRELVASLVTLSRMDEEDSPLHPQDFPISDAVRETAESFADFAESKGHVLQLDIAPGLTYCGDEYAVRQLVSILLDNAARYAAPGAPILLSLQKARRGVVLRERNDCEGLDPAVLDRLFDRFYRPDEARSAAGGGFGIGLSIARSIAEGHRGSIRAKSADDGRAIEFIAELK